MPNAEDYAKTPNHPLNGVSQKVLDAGRIVTNAAVMTNDISPIHADAIADAVIASALPVIFDWIQSMSSCVSDDDNDDDDDRYRDECRAMEIAVGDDYPR